MSRFLILVPARYGSSRFPGKPLAKINGKPMIQYVAQNCENSGFDYAIVTDNDEIEACVKNFAGKFVRIDDDVPSGSERIALAYQRYFKDKKYEFVINVQGDEPLLKGETIKKIAEAHSKTNFDIYTAVKPRSSEEEDFKNPNVVKAIVCDSTSQCLYFSRESIPFSRADVPHEWHQHIGIYSYRVESLERFVTLNPSPLENMESLEQLRALENGLTIGAYNSNIKLLGVDTPEDIKKVEGVLSGE